MKIECEPGDVRFFFDDQLIKQVQDMRFTSGYATYWAADATVRYDNVVLIGDDVPDTGPSGLNSSFAVQPKGKLATAWPAMR